MYQEKKITEEMQNDEQQDKAIPEDKEVLQHFKSIHCFSFASLKYNTNFEVGRICTNRYVSSFRL